ncbi:MAG: ChbG/HpnK family deacetylase [Magnetococcales bacterium]|nr:ChbG/HpnK family deacetylase [Magnetococcales bacterium]
MNPKVFDLESPVNRMVVDSVVSCVINADDLGISPEVNEKIFSLLDGGQLKSASLLVNGPAIAAAVARVAAYPHCSFGVHLNLTYGPPLTCNEDLNPILDGNGMFFEEFDRDRLTPAVQEAVFEEWRVQVETARAMGVAVSHLDSHHHVHRIAALLPCLTRLQRQLRIDRLRGSWTIFPESGAGYPFGHPQAFHETRTTQAFAALHTFMAHFGDNRSQPGPRIWELMTHPGSPNDGDTSLLLGGWRERLCFPVEILSFHEL